MKEKAIIISYLLLLFAVGFGLAFILPVKAGIGVVITFQLVILAALGAMTISGDKTGDKSMTITGDSSDSGDNGGGDTGDNEE